MSKMSNWPLPVHLVVGIPSARHLMKPFEGQYKALTKTLQDPGIHPQCDPYQDRTPKKGTSSYSRAKKAHKHKLSVLGRHSRDR